MTASPVESVALRDHLIRSQTSKDSIQLFSNEISEAASREERHVHSRARRDAIDRIARKQHGHCMVAICDSFEKNVHELDVFDEEVHKF